MKLNSGFAAFCRRLTLGCVVALALPGSALAAPVPATVTGPATVAEGATKATYTINCGTSAPGDTPSIGQINYTTSGGSEDIDYTKTSGSVVCLQPTHTIDVPITQDALDEPNETFKFTISAGDAPPFSGTIGTPAEVTTAIVDDDVPVASIAAIAQVLEGDAGTSNATLGVTLSQASWQDISIPFSTQDQGAVGGSDYTATNTTLTIPAGQLSGQIAVPIIGDTIFEPAEGLFVNLGTPDTAKVTVNNTKTQGIVVIFDNDPKPVPVFSLGGNVTVTEGTSGTINAVFTVTLTPAADGDTQVAWKTGNGSAILNDYAGNQGILKFAKGETSKTFSVDIKGDTRKEPDEYFGVYIEGPVGGTIGKASAGGIIVNDDVDAPPAGSGPKVTIGKPVRDGKKLIVLLTCPTGASACNGKLAATAGRIKVGRGKFALTKDGASELTFKMSLKARRALRKRGLRVKFTAVAKDEAGAEGRSVRTYKIKKLKRPR